ncbi:MAG: SDR family oxidoreductase [Verrucomicrobiales bacterium]
MVKVEQGNGSDGAPVVWITGAAGLIGNYLIYTASSAPYQVKARGITRSDVDLLDFAAVEKLFRLEHPSAIIHCAAISKSPECEAKPKLALQVNFELTRFLSEIASKIPFIFLSSDLVFDGEKGNYIEADQPNPLSIYAETKVKAEEAVLCNPRHTVARTSLNAGRSITRDRAFNEEMKKAWASGKSLNLFTDEFRCPIPAASTAETLWKALAAGLSGVWHIAGRERLSRFEIGQILLGYLPQYRDQIIPGTRKNYNGPPRPPDTSLNCQKIEAALGMTLPSFSAWMKLHAPEIT